MRALAIGIFLITALGTYGLLAGHFPGDNGLFARLALDLLLSFVCVLVHELGHAAAAARLGARIGAVVVLPFELRLRPRRLRLRWRARGDDLGGYVAYTLDRIDARRKHMLIAAAGPAANVLLAGIAGFAASRMDLRSAAGAITGALAFLSGGMALANLIPFKGSDGQAILRGAQAGKRQPSQNRSL